MTFTIGDCVLMLSDQENIDEGYPPEEQGMVVSVWGENAYDKTADGELVLTSRRSGIVYNVLSEHTGDVEELLLEPGCDRMKMSTEPPTKELLQMFYHHMSQSIYEKRFTEMIQQAWRIAHHETCT